VSPDSNAVANSGFVVLDQSVLVFDTHFTPEAGEALLSEIRSITSKPVRYVANSHWHADHTHGNQVFSNAQLIGHTNTRRDMLQIDLPSSHRTAKIAESQLEKLRKEMLKETVPAQIRILREQIMSREEYLQTASRLKISAPVVTLDDELTLRDGNQIVRFLYLGAGHTDGDIVLFLPAYKIAFVGDLFFSHAIPNVQDASILQWMKTLRELLKLDADMFVPGHGSPGSKKDIESFLQYFDELKSLVQPSVDRGDVMEQAAREIQIPEKYSSYQFQNFFQSNVQKMFAEIKALKLETPPAENPAKTDARRQPKQ
jgi:glyoxylase-like metal-dependent hydrolase (beta-lactamase superfamily II)